MRALALAALLLAMPMQAAPAAAQEDYWPDLRVELWGERKVEDAGARLRLVSPERAEHASRAPVTLLADRRADPNDPITRVWLLLERNPAPVVATFQLDANATLAELSTVIRVNEDQPMRAVAETRSGRLLMARTDVKGAGGCAEGGFPIYALGRDAKDGDMTFESGEVPLAALAYPRSLTGLREGTLRISHPNHSGFTRDPAAMHYIPAEYVETVEVGLDGAPILIWRGSISISRDPMLTFAFLPGEAERLTVRATDTDGETWEESFALEPEGS